MPKRPYEILLRFDDAGNFQGGHTIRRDSVTGKLEDAQPIGADTAFPWPAVVAEIKGAVAEVTALRATVAEQGELLRSLKPEIDRRMEAEEAELLAQEAALAERRQKLAARREGGGLVKAEEK